MSRDVEHPLFGYDDREADRREHERTRRPVHGVPCPRCRGNSTVSDSRALEHSVRRRRRCVSCGERFTTYERLSDAPEDDPDAVMRAARRILLRLLAELPHPAPAPRPDGLGPILETIARSKLKEGEPDA